MNTSATDSARPDPGWSRRDLLAALALIAATLAAYFPALSGGFVWDDDTHLTANLVLQEHGLFRVWFTSESSNYWPLTWSSYWVEHHLWGLDPRGYHVTNAVLHAVNSLLFWRVLRMLGLPGAWLASLVFALHPVNVESVAWITQRKNLLSLVFYLVSLLAFLRSEERGGSKSWYRGAVAAFLLSMLAKGAGVTLPVILLLLAWWRRGRITRRDVGNAIPFFAVALGMSAIEILFQYGNAMGMGSVRDASLAERTATAGWVVWFYLGKAFLPLDLSFVYPRWTVDASRLQAWLPDLALAALFLVGWRLRDTAARHALVALAFFVITLGPVVGFLDFYYLKYSFVADHYPYFALMGPIAWAVCSGSHLAARLPAPLSRTAAAAAGILVVFLFVLTWQGSGRFEDRETLWRVTLATNPDAGLAHYNLARMLQGQERLEEAEHHYRETLRLDPEAANAHSNLGMVLCRRDACGEGMEHYRRALEISPDYLIARNNLAGALRRSGRLQEALEQYRLALAHEPGNATVRSNYAYTLREAGDPEQAAVEVRRAVELEPDLALARLLLAELLQEEGRPAEAVAELRALIRQRPDHARAHLELARLLATTAPRESLVHYRRVVQLRPGWPVPRGELQVLQEQLAGAGAPRR